MLNPTAIVPMSTLLFIGCMGCSDIVEITYWKDRDYKVQDDPGATCKTLYRKLDEGGGIGRISCISKLGYDKRYIICESLDQNGQEPDYWIINKEQDDDYKNAVEIVEGPLSIQQFIEKKAEYGISKLEFQKSWILSH